jgi:uncharacterized membrane protein
VTEQEQREQPWVVPTSSDPLARGALPLLGGPFGRRAALGRGFWTPVRVCLAVGMAVFAVGWLSKGYCAVHGWGAPQRYMYLCYSDIPILYGARGLDTGEFPYLSGSGSDVLEYPVLTGVFTYLAAMLTRMIGGGMLAFYAINVVLLGVAFAWTIVSTCRYVLRRPWDGLLLAMAPVVALSAFINWDLLAVALAAAAMAAWSARRPAWAGVLIGLAAAAKFYPLVRIGPVVLLCLRRGQVRALAPFLTGAVGAWLAVNLPIMLLNFEGWSRFYTFSRERGTDFGSPWYALSLGRVPIAADHINTYVTASLVIGLAGVVALALFSPTPPRLAQLALLTVGVFVLTNKVYSPQYVLWVLPFAVLARPRWRDLLIWQLLETCYFLAIWWYLVGFGTSDKGLHYGAYALAVGLHWVGTAWFMGMVVRDILRPEHDPVRADGFAEHRDDPGGGVLDGKPDVLPWSRPVPVASERTAGVSPG